MPKRGASYAPSSRLAANASTSSPNDAEEAPTLCSIGAHADAASSTPPTSSEESPMSLEQIGGCIALILLAVILTKGNF